MRRAAWTECVDCPTLARTARSSTQLCAAAADATVRGIPLLEPHPTPHRHRRRSGRPPATGVVALEREPHCRERQQGAGASAPPARCGGAPTQGRCATRRCAGAATAPPPTWTSWYRLRSVILLSNVQRRSAPERGLTHDTSGGRGCARACPRSIERVCASAHEKNTARKRSVRRSKIAEPLWGDLAWRSARRRERVSASLRLAPSCLYDAAAATRASASSSCSFEYMANCGTVFGPGTANHTHGGASRT